MSTGNLVKVVFVNCESTSACMVGLQNMESEICSRFYVRLRAWIQPVAGLEALSVAELIGIRKQAKKSFFQRGSTAATLKRMMR